MAHVSVVKEKMSKMSKFQQSNAVLFELENSNDMGDLYLLHKAQCDCKKEHRIGEIPA